MSIEACWTVRFGNPHAPDTFLNGGIVILESGRIFGGDSGFAYLGTYEVKGQTVEGSFKVVRHDPNWESMYGDDGDFQATLSAMQQSDGSYRGTIVRAGFPNAVIVLRRLAELP